MKIVILGGGPTGLGAAWRLKELGHKDWKLFEKESYWGGLSTSFMDDDGFCWDVGGHVLFSHYPYFDTVMDTLLGEKEGWVFHDREAWIWMQDGFVPYPLQNNIHLLPKHIFLECLVGIIDARVQGNHTKLSHFGDWIDASFGKGIAKWFLRPYNFKTWAFPVEKLGWKWVGDRVALVDYEKILENLIYNKTETSWGPNSRFKFPLNGGTGAIWDALSKRLPQEKCHLNHEVKHLSIGKKEVVFTDGKKENYDILLTTLPVSRLTLMSDIQPPFDDPPPLKYSSSHIVGLALKGNPPDHLSTKCWIYFPENNCPFYRVTVFSNYSPNNVPDIKNQWSLMCEVSESTAKTVDHSRVVDDVIQGAINTKLISNKQDIHHTWYHFVEESYPTPSRGRNDMLFPLLSHLEDHQIYSRGRFGAWRYEVGNMDHSFMQGAEFANHVLNSEEELTVWHPEIVNR